MSLPYKRVESGNTRISIYPDECVPHPFESDVMQCGIACWSTNEYFGNFLPENAQNATLITSRETMKKYLKDNPDVVAYGLEWWGKCGSDAPYLTLHPTFDIDDESIDGAIFVQNHGGDMAQTGLTIRQEHNLLNAYLGGCVYMYVIEQKCKCEWSADDQWVMTKDGCVGGFYHSLDRENGDREMYESMFSDLPRSPELHSCYCQLIENAGK